MTWQLSGRSIELCNCKMQCPCWLGPEIQRGSSDGVDVSGTLQLASSKGSRWPDPQLREWQGDSGTLHQFDWSA